jgi:hypothetical protein
VDFISPLGELINRCVFVELLGTSCFVTNRSVINECDAPESNKTVAGTVDKERTEHNILGLLGFFSCHMVHPTMHIILLAFVTFLRCLHIALRANTGIVSQFSAVETSTEVNWISVPYWCT